MEIEIKEEEMTVNPSHTPKELNEDPVLPLDPPSTDQTEAPKEKIPRYLEDRYSWPQLGELFAQRIEESKFIEKGWNRQVFCDWFNEREKLGLRFDWRLVAREYSIWKNLHKQHDHFTVIIGKEGQGKTTLAVQTAAWVSPSFILEDLVFNMEHYIKLLKENAVNYHSNKKKDVTKSMVIDEGGISLFSREALSDSNKILAKTFMVQRFLNVDVRICIPHYWSLDPIIRNHRINTLIIIKQRGKYKAIVGRGIEILNKLGAKDKTKPLEAIPIPYGYFWEGEFNVDFPNTISKKKYEEYKHKHILGFLEDISVQSQSVKMINIKIIERELGITPEILIKDINDGTLEGRKIGNKWFITKKAYEKLLMVPKS